MVRKAATMFEAGINAGAEANMAKMLASEAAWAAAEMCVQTHGGFGFAEEYDVERKFREARLYTVAPISTNMILNFVAEHVLGPAALVLARSCFSSNRPWRESTGVHSGVDRLDADGTRVSGQSSTNPPIPALEKTPSWSAPLQWRSGIMSAPGVARSDDHHHARDTA